MDSRGPTPEQAYDKVAGNFVPGLLLTLALAGLCLWLSGRLPLIAKLVFFVLGLNAVFDLVGAVGTVGGGIAVRIISRREREPLPVGEKWMIAGTVVKVVDAAISIAVVVLLIPRVWR